MAVPTKAELTYMEEHIGDNKVPSIVVANVVCGLAAYSAVGVRLYARRLSGVKLGRDDYCIMAALVSYAGYIISYCITTAFGMGRHAISMKNPQGFVGSAIAAQSCYEVNILLIKFSILFLYRRIFPQVWFKKTLLGIGVFILCNNTAQFLVNVLQCVPIEHNWDPLSPGNCVNFGLHVLVEGIINIVTDFVILALPLPVLWRLQLSRIRKWQLSGMFLMGGIVCIVSIVRLFYVLRVGSADPTWNDVEGATISTVEICVGIISACLPTYRILFRRGRQTSGAIGLAAYQSYPPEQKRLGAIISSLGKSRHNIPKTRSEDQDEML